MREENPGPVSGIRKARKSPGTMSKPLCPRPRGRTGLSTVGGRGQSTV